ncbi:hypothetical protein DSM21852_10500 [Methylocystis bryophila]|nr:hypothetical protein DSM21852_10500 [Methylocystis bryophila]
MRVTIAYRQAHHALSPVWGVAPNSVNTNAKTDVAFLSFRSRAATVSAGRHRRAEEEDWDGNVAAKTAGNADHAADWRP